MTPKTSKNSSYSITYDPFFFIDADLNKKLKEVYDKEKARCTIAGTSDQHIDDEWFQTEIRNICGYETTSKWLKEFRYHHKIFYAGGRRHSNSAKKPPKGLKNSLSVPEKKSGYTDVEEKVKKIVNEHQRQGERLTNPWIIELALKIASQFHPELPDISEYFNNIWVQKFKKKYNITLKPNFSEYSAKESLEPIVVDELNVPVEASVAPFVMDMKRGEELNNNTLPLFNPFLAPKIELIPTLAFLTPEMVHNAMVQAASSFYLQKFEQALLDIAASFNCSQ